MKPRCTFAILLLLIGCGPLVTAPASHDTDPVLIDQANAPEIWRALAQAVDHGAISRSHRLAQFIVVLTRHGELSASDVAAFDKAFSGAAKSDRTLDADDVKRLKDLADDSQGQHDRRLP